LSKFHSNSKADRLVSTGAGCQFATKWVPTNEGAEDFRFSRVSPTSVVKKRLTRENNLPLKIRESCRQRSTNDQTVTARRVPARL
jgi:hypothetical protein